MRILPKAQMLAERNAWSFARAQGFLDGEQARGSSTVPSISIRVGLDDYCVGFRAGYYIRGSNGHGRYGTLEHNAQSHT